jgi:putative transposase
MDALACLHAAVAEAERVLGFDDLRADRGEFDLIDEITGEILDIVPAPIAVVLDNGSCFRGETYRAAFADDDPLLRHVRTRVDHLRPTASSNGSSAPSNTSKSIGR